MGSGTYSVQDRYSRATAAGYDSKPASEIFSKRFDLSMNPKDVKLRESRDSEEHPNSLAIIIVLDVTGSMGKIPLDLIRTGLPNMIEKIIELGVKDPQVMFVAITDHLSGNSAPLQISQFESSDEMLDHWLTTVWLEGGGGNNNGESYMLAHYFAAKYTSIDCFEKFREKGFIISIGDDKAHNDYSSGSLEAIFGNEHSSMTKSQILDLAKEKYHVYHIHTGDEASRGVIKNWNKLLGENFYVVPDHTKIPHTIANIIANKVNTSNPELDVDNDQNDLSATNDSQKINIL